MAREYDDKHQNKWDTIWYEIMSGIAISAKGDCVNNYHALPNKEPVSIVYTKREWWSLCKITQRLCCHGFVHYHFSKFNVTTVSALLCPDYTAVTIEGL